MHIRHVVWDFDGSQIEGNLNNVMVDAHEGLCGARAQVLAKQISEQVYAGNDAALVELFAILKQQGKLPPTKVFQLQSRQLTATHLIQAARLTNRTVSMASRSGAPREIRHYLKTELKLEETDNLIIKVDQHAPNKNSSMEATNETLRTGFKLNVGSENTLLVDDSKGNRDAAKAAGYEVLDPTADDFVEKYVQKLGLSVIFEKMFQDKAESTNKTASPPVTTTAESKDDKVEMATVAGAGSIVSPAEMKLQGVLTEQQGKELDKKIQDLSSAWCCSIGSKERTAQVEALIYFKAIALSSHVTEYSDVLIAVKREHPKVDITKLLRTMKTMGSFLEAPSAADSGLKAPLLPIKR